MKRFLLRTARCIALVYLGLCLLLAGCQQSMLYFPTRQTEAAALATAARDGIEPWRDTSGRITGWRQPAPRAAARLVVFHGNAGCALDRGYYIDGFGPGWEVFLFEYPGYGPRAGSPGKDSFIEAGRAAIEELLAADSRPLFVLGESIGSGTAAALAGAMPGRIAGVVMMIPFARLDEVAREKLPWLPAALLLRDKFDNIAALQNYRGPVAIVVAEKDEVVGPTQGRKLHTSYSGPKKLILLPGATHNGFPAGADAPWFGEVRDFLLPAR